MESRFDSQYFISRRSIFNDAPFQDFAEFIADRAARSEEIAKQLYPDRYTDPRGNDWTHLVWASYITLFFFLQATRAFLLGHGSSSLEPEDVNSSIQDLFDFMLIATSGALDDFQNNRKLKEIKADIDLKNEDLKTLFAKSEQLLPSTDTYSKAHIAANAFGAMIATHHHDSLRKTEDAEQILRFLVEEVKAIEAYIDQKFMQEGSH